MKRTLVIALFAALPCLALATSQEDRAQTALQGILAQADLEIIHAKALPDGSVELIFGVSVDDDTQIDIVQRLQAHPDVAAVHAQASPRTFCRID
jgi:acyl-CoA reductase-like NAD-dependent aldehyde dehydrogenase